MGIGEATHLPGHLRIEIGEFGTASVGTEKRGGARRASQSGRGCCCWVWLWAGVWAAVWGPALGRVRRRRYLDVSRAHAPVIL